MNFNLIKTKITSESSLVTLKFESPGSYKKKKKRGYDLGFWSLSANFIFSIFWSLQKKRLFTRVKTLEISIKNLRKRLFRLSR
jgi:hypothetical protein